MAVSLRSKEDQIFGFPSLLPENVLPTRSDILKRMLLSKQSLAETTGKTIIPVTQIVKPIIGEVILLWGKASLPTIAYKGIEKALSKLWEQAKNGLKNEKAKEQVQMEKLQLFDICSCKCKRISCEQKGCKSDDCEEVHIDCTCEPLKMVPERELSFLFDQRESRKMMMLGVDGKVTQCRKRAQKREAAFEAQKEKEKKRVQNESENQAQANHNFFDEGADDEMEEDMVSSDKDWEPKQSTDSRSIPQTRNMHPLPKTAEALDRWGVSSRAGADIVNAYALDMGFLTAENKMTMTVDKCKLDRWRKTGRKDIQKKQEMEISSKPVTGFYFDGKKDSTLTRVQKGEKFYTKTVIEDHYVMLEEPGSVFLGHEVPYSGHGISIGLKLFRFLKSKGWEGSIYVVGADGCNVNVGNKEGALVHLEKLLGRPLHWFICQLHGCELPFRAIVRSLDGGTSGPFTLKGPIGSTLNEDLTELEVVPFKKIPNPDFPVVAEEESYELSKDQAYLYRMCHAIMNGNVPDDLANQETGPLSNARWGTLANALLRKYASTASPSKQFKDIVHAIVHFYAPSWFQIKTHPRCTDGPKNFLKMIQFSRKLGQDLQKVVQKVLQRNGYFAHPEAILLAMLADDAELRGQAVNTILTIRMKADLQNQEPSTEIDDGRGVDEEDDDNEIDDEDEDEAFKLDPFEKKALSSSNIRKFIIPKINFDAQTYAELIDWESAKLTEPPLTSSLTEAEVMSFKESPYNVPKYPCHTQAVERGIRLVSEASSAVIGPEARNGFIRQRIQARKELGEFHTKKDYFPKIEASYNDV